jgi:tRNA(fMet)-specific endonuclease VapC
MFIADTDVLIDYLRGRGPGASRVALELTHSLSTTVVTAFELWSGAHGKRQAAAIEALVAAMDILPLDAAAARRAASVRRELEVAGATIGMADSLIAGIALERRAMLITRNVRHFSRVTGLKLATIGGGEE